MPSVDRVLRFQKAIVQGADATAAWLDVDVMTSYMAVDRVIANDDGAFHLCCGGDTDRLWIVPWDLDHSMSDRTDGPHVTSDWRKPVSADACSVRDGLMPGAAGPPSACDALFKNLPTWLPAYEAKIDRFIAGRFSKQFVDADLALWKKQIQRAGFAVDEAAWSDLIRGSTG